jgi:hypothetical protein
MPPPGWTAIQLGRYCIQAKDTRQYGSRVRPKPEAARRSGRPSCGGNWKVDSRGHGHHGSQAKDGDKCARERNLKGPGVRGQRGRNSDHHAWTPTRSRRILRVFTRFILQEIFASCPALHTPVDPEHLNFLKAVRAPGYIDLVIDSQRHPQ